MSRRQVLVRWLMVVVLLSVWPGGIAAAAQPTGPRHELPHPIIPCTPAELPEQAVPVESCPIEDPGTVPASTTTTTVPASTTTTTVRASTTTTTVPASTTTTTVPASTTTTTVPASTTTTTTVVEQSPTPDRSPPEQTQQQPADPGPGADSVPCVHPQVPDEAVPDTCPAPEEPGSPGSPSDPAVTDPGSEGSPGQTPEGGAGASTPPTPTSGSSTPDPSTPAEPATPASPSSGEPATPAEPATQPEPAQPLSSPTQADPPSAPSASVQPQPPAASPGPVDLVEVEQVGELLAFLQPDALPDPAGFGALDVATGPTARRRPSEPTLAAGLDLVLPPPLQTTRSSYQPGDELVAQAVQQLLRSLALPLAATGLLAMGLLQAGGLSTQKKSRLRR
ncbi:MAG: hypothetical protein ACRD02_10625 [Acidimicrobiia bacterium]